MRSFLSRRKRGESFVASIAGMVSGKRREELLCCQYIVPQQKVTLNSPCAASQVDFAWHTLGEADNLHTVWDRIHTLDLLFRKPLRRRELALDYVVWVVRRSLHFGVNACL